MSRKRVRGDADRIVFRGAVTFQRLLMPMMISHSNRRAIVSTKRKTPRIRAAFCMVFQLDFGKLLGELGKTMREAGNFPARCFLMHDPALGAAHQRGLRRL